MAKAVKRKTTRKTSASSSKRSGAAKKTALTQEELKSLIEKRAYELYLERGCTHGDDAGDWYRAEKEIKSKYRIKN